MNKFKITFKEKKKYHPATRVVEVQTMGSVIHAINLTHLNFGYSKRIEILLAEDLNTKKVIDFSKVSCLYYKDGSGIAQIFEEETKITPVEDGTMDTENIITLKANSDDPEGKFDGFSQVVETNNIVEEDKQFKDYCRAVFREEIQSGEIIEINDK